MTLKELVKESYYYTKQGMLLRGDCLGWMPKIPDQSVNLILCDLPYGTTKCSWDAIIPFDIMWKEYNRILKPNGMMVLTATQPFTSALIASNFKQYKYNWTWEKNRPTGFANAKKRPLKITEDICVFGGSTYYPQGLEKIDKQMKNSKSKIIRSTERSQQDGGAFPETYTQEYTNYPRNVLQFDIDEPKLHPTQKPVALFEYLIKTYTQENDIVLDNTSGVGTTALAAENTNRKWICIERDLDENGDSLGFCDLTVDRLKKNLIKA